MILGGIQQPQEKRCKMRYTVNCNVSEKTTMTIAAETAFREDVIGKI